MEIGIRAQKGTVRFYLLVVLSEIPDVLHDISLIARFGSEKKFP